MPMSIVKTGDNDRLKSLITLAEELETLHKSLNNNREEINDALDTLEKSLQNSIEDELLIKAAGHKYIRREQKGGKWIYWYRDASGKEYSSDKGPSAEGEKKTEQGGAGKLTKRSDGYFYTEKGQKITNDPEKAKQYEEKHIARTETPTKADIQPGMKIRINATAKGGGVREHRRGIVGTINSIQDGMVNFVDETGKAFRAPINILEFAKSRAIQSEERHSYSGYGNQAKKRVKGYKSGYKKPSLHSRIGRSFKRAKPKVKFEE